MKVERTNTAMLVIGVILLFVYLSLSPMSHHYMMMGPFYLGVIPVVLGLIGVGLILFAVYNIYITKSSKTQLMALQHLENTGETINQNNFKEKLKMATKLLNEDEALVLRIVAENEGITQDSLRSRTEFSHSKISMIIKKLEERDLIVRERFGKTFKIYLSEWVKD